MTDDPSPAPEGASSRSPAGEVLLPYLHALQAEVETHYARARDLAARLEAAEADHAACRAALDETRARLDAVLGSRGGRALAPLRRLRAWLARTR